MVLHVNMHAWIPFPNWRPMDHIRHLPIESQLCKYPPLSNGQSSIHCILCDAKTSLANTIQLYCDYFKPIQMEACPHCYYTIISSAFFHSPLHFIYIIDGNTLLSMYVCMHARMYVCMYVSTCVVQEVKLKTQENSHNL